MATTQELIAARDAALASPAVVAAVAAEEAALVEYKAAQAAFAADSSHPVYAALVAAQNKYEAAGTAVYRAKEPARAFQTRIDKIARDKVARHIWG